MAQYIIQISIDNGGWRGKWWQDSFPFTSKRQAKQSLRILKKGADDGEEFRLIKIEEQ